MNSTASRFTILMGSASLLTMTASLTANAQQMAQAPQTAAIPEQVLVTGSLIHGTAAVGVPVTNLGEQDLTVTGNATLGDLFRTIPLAIVAPGPSAVVGGGHQERETRVNLRGLDGTAPRALMMIDGVRFPPQADGLCAIDPSVIPELALDRIDILADGASATYGSDAISGVINVVLKRNFDGATTKLHFQKPDKGGQQYQASQLYGRTWDGGDITVTYEYMNEAPIKKAHSNYTMNFAPWGLDNEIPIGSSLPGTVSTGKPTVTNGMGRAGVGTVCANCFSIPVGAGANFNPINNGIGPTVAGSAATLTWAQLQALPGVKNLVDPLPQGWEQAAQQKNSFVATFDQRLFPGISFFFTGFYTNRRVQELTPTYYSDGGLQDIQTFAVPTTNPYYPTGAPAGLQVSYDLGKEYPPYLSAYEISARYQFGFNLDLPFGWSGQIYESRSYESDKFIGYGANDNAVSIALGNTVSGVSKPASVPYINLFCDPTAFKCNSQQTIAYIGGQRFNAATDIIEEKGARFDGPLFDLPAGQVKAAVGGTYESDNIFASRYNNFQVTPLSVAPGVAPFGPVPADLNSLSASVDPEPHTVWAGFAQVDIPLFGDNFNLPLVRKFDLEASWRHDKYSSPNAALNGKTSNPKIAFTWRVDDNIGATIRGSWGTSFRLPNISEYSLVAKDTVTVFGFNGSNGIPIACVSGQPTAGSLFAALSASGLACGSQQGGVSWGGGPQPSLRSFTNAATGQIQLREGGLTLLPETAQNYSAGLEIAPEIEFLKGLDLQATWYSIKIDKVLGGGAAPNTTVLSDPTQRFHLIVPSDVGCPVTANARPTTCAPFEAMVAAALGDIGSPAPVSAASSVFWINDAGVVNSGFLHLSGIDWNASYDVDLGDYGAWNTGVTGTYYLHNWSQTVAGGQIVDNLRKDIAGAGGILQNGVTTMSQLVYRARLGWSGGADGAYSVTGFMNYQSHYYSSTSVPPNVNLQCTSAGGTVGGGTFPCAINNFINIEPSFVTFDLSFGYNTGDRPANNYLKNMTIQLTVQNILDRLSPFQYNPTNPAGRQASAYDPTRPNTGRTIGITLVKNW